MVFELQHNLMTYNYKPKLNLKQEKAKVDKVSVIFSLSLDQSKWRQQQKKGR
jgi:hypothetical protein